MTMNHDVTTTEESTREDLPPTIQDIEGYPLSPQQKRLWSLHPDPAQIPVLTFEITVAGTLGTPVLDNALRELCHRHEILHTVFHPAPGLSLPLQVLVEPTPEIHHLDLGPITPEAREDTLREAREELARPFDPEQGPQWRALVWREAADAHRLLIAGSALVVDTGTGAVLVQALAEILSDAEPDEDLLQYAQFCDWQSDLVEGEEGEEARDFWRFETASQLEAAMLPGARRQARGRDRQRFEIPLDGDWLDAPEPPSEVEGGFDSFFLAAWQAVLARYGGDEGFAIGGVIDGRKYSELDVMPGPFSRAVPLRSRLTEARPLAEIAGKLARDLEESRDWLEGFLGEAGEEPARFAVGFESLDLLHRSETGDLTLTLAEVRGGTEPFALQLLCRRGPKGWKATIEYDQGIFDARSIERLARSWARILADAVRRPGVATGRLDWLAEQDRADLSASGPRREHPPRLVPDRFRDQARKTPNAIAVSDGERQLTYAELAEQARELADELAHRGIGAEQAVGLLMDRGVELVVGILGVLEAGAAYVPLDPEYPSQRLTYMADDSRLELVLTLERYLEAWELPQQALALDTPAWRAATNAADRGDDEASPRLTAGHLAYVLYTSGSTGRPKGVMISHGSLANYVDTVLTDYALTDGEAVPIHSSFSFDLTVTSLFPPLLGGRRIELAPRSTQVEALATVLEARDDLAWIKLTPGHCRVLARQVDEGRLETASRALILGGEALRPVDIEAWRSAAPATRLLNEYGPTEATVGCCLYEVGSSEWEEDCDTLPIGRPTSGVRLLVLDEHLREVPFGRTGELFIAGAGLARGYRKQPALTAERFLPHPEPDLAGERLYRTGDLARFLPDGQLLFLGRGDQQIKVRGFRIEPAEIEAALAEHPAIRDAAVLADGGQGEERLIAYLVHEDGGDETSPQVSELRDFLARTLPDYMLPALFVRLDELPFNAHGKLDRAALPAPEESAVTSAYIAPRTVEEEILSGIWAQVLGLERIGIDDDFFALGGDSIRSIPVVSLAQKQGLGLTLEILFAQRTVRKVAQALDEAIFAEAEEEAEETIEPFAMLEPEDRRQLPDALEDAYPLSRLQAGMIFHLAANPSASLYHDVFSYSLKARLEVEALRIAVARLVASHPTLRTRFELRRFSEPLQEVYPVESLPARAALPLDVHDLRHLDPAEQQEIPAAFIAEERNRGFDPRQLPLLRFTVHLWSEESFQFTVSFHHAILDGWSDASMLIELGITYISLLRAQEAPFAPPVTRHRDFVALERRALADPEIETFWRQLLHEVPAAPLPRPAGVVDDGSTAPIWAHVPVSRELSTALEAVARRAAVPLKSVLLAAHLRALAFLTGENDVLTCVTSNGRPERRDGERVLGLFLNSMPFRIRLEGGRWDELVQQVFDLERRSLPHRRYPMAEIQRWHAEKNLLESSFYFTHYHIVHQLDEFPEVEVRNIEFHEATSFPLVANFHVDPFIDQIRVELTLARRLFDVETGERMAEVYARVLEAVARGGEGRYESLDLLGAAQRQEILVDWNAPTGPPVADPWVHRRILEQAERAPEREAVRDGESSWTWAELDRGVRALAHRLVAEGIGPESVVGVCLERSPELVVVLLAVLEAGGAYLPLEPDAPAQRSNFLLADAGASMVITRSSVARFSNERPADTRWLDLDREDLVATAVADSATIPPRPAPPPESLAYIIYTSGSTGRPKGVGVSHRSFAGYVAWASETYGGVGNGSLVHSSIAFDLTLTALFVPLFAGKSITLTESGDGVAPLVRALGRERDLSFVKLTPSHARLLATQLDAEVAGHARALILGGEALQGEDLAFWRQQAPEVEIYNEYGPTEAVVGCSLARRPAANLGEGPVSIGRPARGARLYLLDRFGQPAAPGVPAEIWIGGGLARGYLGRPALTADRFRPDPFAEGTRGGERLYRSGDLARFAADGQLEYLGRLDHQVKIRGHRVEPGEVAAALRAHAAVAEAVVIADSEADDPRLIAYLVGRGGVAMPSVEEWRELLARDLPEYMIPARFQTLTEIPLTVNGKLDRARLPRPEGDRPHLASKYAPPQTLEEEVLVALWSQVLGVERVGIDDDYFALGGDSIRSLQLVAAARERDLVLSMETLFEHPTIRRLAASLSGTGAAEAHEAPEPFALLSAADRQRLPLAGGAPVDAYPLTRLQAGMLYHRELDPTAALYHNVNQFEIEAPFDPDRLRRALQLSSRRHPALRTRFVTSGFREPLAVVEEEIEPALTFVDLRHLSEPEQRAALLQAARAEHERGFEVSRAPLARFGVYRTDDRLFTLSLSFHHAIFDGWSNVTMLTELALAYHALLDGAEPESSARPESTAFREYVALERLALESTVSREFWQEQLAGARPQRLPRERLDPAPTSELGRLAVEQELSDELSRDLRDVATALAIPLKSVLLAVHLRVLSWLVDEPEILTCLISSGRPERADAQASMGLFLNSLPLRLLVRQGRDETWSELAQRVFDAERRMLPYRRFPMAEMQRWHAGQQLSETSFNYTHYHVLDRLDSCPGLTLRGTRSYEKTSFPLAASFHLDPFSNRLHFHLNGNREQFSATRLERYASYYRRALEALAAERNRPFESTPLLDAEEIELTLHAWNQAGLEAVEHPDQPFHRRFEAQAARSPEAPAVHCTGNDETLTYEQLNRMADRWAEALRRRGVGPERVVALDLSASSRWLVALLAVLKAGGAFLPLDPRWPLARRRGLVDHAGAVLLLTERDSAAELRRAEGPEVIALGELEASVSEPASFPASPSVEVAPEQMAYLIYTSGSTGRPKGVAVGQRQLSQYVQAVSARLRLASCNRFALVSTVAADLGHTLLFGALANGGCLYLVPPESTTDPRALGAVLHENAIDALKIVPSHLAALLAAAEDRERLLPRRLLILGGEAAGTELLRAVRALRPELRLVNHYGPTETTVGVAAGELEGDEDRPLPIGKPLPGARLYVLDHDLRPRPAGAAGELYIGGSSLARGYLDGAAGTAERFVPDPFATSPGQRLYRSGDLARHRRDGRLELLGRRDHQVKVRGFRIELAEVEAALLAVEGVAQAAARIDSRTEPTLVAHVAPSPGSDVDPEGLREALRKTLPAAMVPSFFLLTYGKGLPLTANGKIDREALARLPLPDEAEGLEAVPGDEAPRSPVEEMLVARWADLLGRPRLGRRADFFALGGHSLLALRLVARLRTDLEVEVAMHELFEHPTPEAMARLVDSKLREGGTALGPIETEPRDQPLPLSFPQQRLWFLDQLAPDNAFYNVPAAVRLRGRLRPAALERCLYQLVCRHETLRTTFPSQGGQPVQVIAEPRPVRLARIDLSGLAPAAAEAEGQRLRAKEARRPFRLGEGPLLRASLIELGNDDHLLLFTLHHIISDGWSTGLLIREVAALYHAQVEDRSPTLPTLTVQYADYAVWQRRWMSEEFLEQQLDHWRRTLAGAPLIFELPTDRPRPMVETFRGGVRQLVVPRSFARRLEALSRDLGGTPFMVALATFEVALARFSGQDDFVVGTPIANRNRPELDPMIGFFVNELVLRSDLRDGGDLSFRAHFERVRRTTLEALAHSDLPFERLVQELRPERDLSRNPLFQVALVYNETLPALELPGLALEVQGGNSQTSKMDLSLFLRSAADGNLSVSLEYNSDLFDATTSERLLRHFRALLEAVGEDPERNLSSLDALSAAERHQLLHEWNDERRSFASLTIPEQFATQVERRGPGLAVVHGERQLSYEELDQLAGDLAAMLAKRSLGREDRVAVCLERSPELVASLLAVLTVGGAFVALDPGHPAERRAAIVADSGADLLLTDRGGAEEMRAALLAAGVEAELMVIEEAPTSDLGLSEGPSRCEPEDLAYLIYTSGSTGRPKGVMVPHRGVLSLVGWQRTVYGVEDETRVSQLASYSFDGAIGETFMALLNGAVLVILTGPETEPPRLSLALGEHGIDVAVVVPSVMAEADPRDLPEGSDLTLVAVGEVCSPELARRWSRHCRVMNGYGPTESTVYSHLWTGDPESLRQHARVPVGRPIHNTSAYVLDRRLCPVAIGGVGELYLAGEGLARGYLERAAITAERFLPDPFNRRLERVAPRIRDGGSLASEAMHDRIRELIEQRPAGRITKPRPDTRRTPEEIWRILGELDPDLQRTMQSFVASCEESSPLYEAFCRYLAEAENETYAASEIDPQTLLTLLGSEDLRGRRGVDFCCGNGEALASLQSLGAEVLGLDLNPLFVQRARKKGFRAEMARLDVPPETFFQATGLAPESLDFATFTLGLDRVARPRDLLRNLFSVLRPGGRFAIQTLLPILPEDDGDAERSIVYTPHRNRLTPGSTVAEDRRLLAAELLRLGAGELTIYHLPYAVASGDGVQEYVVWSFTGSRREQRSELAGQRMYRTGDRVRLLPDGQLDFLGRVDRQIKIRGQRIELGEIEATLSTHPEVRQCAVEALEVSGETRLAAYVVHAGDDIEGAWRRKKEAKRIESWRAVHDGFYTESAAQPETETSPDALLMGWNSSYTGEPLPVAEMRQWADQKVAAISALGPRRILEIGCGSGLLVERLAPGCEHYLGTDLSGVAVRSLERLLRERGIDQVTVRQQAAHDAGGLEEGFFDVVVLNSVIQYFPSAEYLCEVLTIALRALRPGGTVFLGDVRSLALHEAFLLSVELARDPGTTLSPEVLLRRARDRAENEEELLFDPAFFTTLGDRLADLADARIALHPGSPANELGRFRYDVLLTRREAEEPRAPEESIEWHPWTKRAWTVERLERRLREDPAPLALSAIPNARVAAETALLHRLENHEAGGDLRSLVAASHRDAERAVDPESLYVLATETGRQVELSWARGASDGSFEALFPTARSSPSPGRRFPVDPEKARHETSSELSSRPLAAVGFSARLRRYLAARLTPAMVPVHWVELPALPRNAAGKLDRRALPHPTGGREALTVPFVAPRTPIEEQLAAIWGEVLQVEQVGVHDDFFEAGGHSLNATRILARIRERIGRELPLTALFQASTVEQLAARLSLPVGEPRGQESLVAVQPEGERPPFFCITAYSSHVLGYADLARHLGKDQPFYLLRIPDLETYEGLPSIEAVASYHLEQIRQVQPQGPYRLGGWSLSGWIAFEMARQLAQRGEAAAELLLFDSRAPSSGSTPVPVSAEEALPFFAIEMWSFYRPEATDEPPVSSDRSVDENLRVLARALSEFTGEDELPQVRRLFEKARSQYRLVPGGYGGSVHLFCTEATAKKQTMDLGWKAHLKGRFRTERVPGDHFSMLRGKNAAVLARQVTLALDSGSREP